MGDRLGCSLASAREADGGLLLAAASCSRVRKRVDVFRVGPASEKPRLLGSLPGPKPIGLFGQVLVVRDLDGDGSLDLILSDPALSDPEPGEGALFVLHGLLESFEGASE